ncbi:hypothetical protein C343_04963 [Cryptococcus neoformans C23]|uniref:Uncharacterized protein n=2 Tax=Cryptococcus neoformans TaxID=5207 RepID=J9VTU4_CRYN9|nr:hypothetical protein CNAG_07755 [Cryptococcus neoformans var. grubii H99]XP_012051875.1 hypothetical protein, variant 1 [Cryptococcus neoformans var. grubii H99]AUB26795.1 hypothetical protein CKF44_07755 [Cryptococcus neoformans var. grubii]OWZ29143.1 hypothetical protein C347_05009 [Cryptococcus neoformans var. grubii AD2-60a]OWZ36251.1 hypothetical protein C353_04860 [Cryptococcus neoformans var. grubii AD1-83a]OWZ41009.1 hypothetical protein C343_04963 [Cryptococcus neoformans var. grub|eukprot:XP_012051407.1 hypothetical protein CNAG_07755 [Cryptococcus neoformans var. grubii H99]
MKDSLRMQSRFDVTEEKLYRDIDDQHGLRTVPTPAPRRKIRGCKAPKQPTKVRHTYSLGTSKPCPDSPMKHNLESCRYQYVLT